MLSLFQERPKSVNKAVYRVTVNCENWADMINFRFCEFLDAGIRQLRVLEEEMLFYVVF